MTNLFCALVLLTLATFETQSFIFQNQISCQYLPWSSCKRSSSGQMLRTRNATEASRKTGCRTLKKPCSLGNFIGDTFIENLLQPVEPVTGSYSILPDDRGVGGNSHFAALNPGVAVNKHRVISSFGRRRRRRRRYNSARTTTATTTASPNPTIEQNCVEFRDPSNNELILGNCNTDQQRNAATGRSKRSLEEPHRPTMSVQQRNRDLLIIMDESGSIGRERFQKVKRIAAAIVKLLCDNIQVRHDLTRVSVMTFDTTHTLHVPLKRNFAHVDHLASFIMNIKYSGGGTCLNSAMNYALNTAFTSEFGGRVGDPNVEQDIVLITDGCETCTSTEAIRVTSSRLIENKINVYVIGVGLQNSCKHNLKILAQGGRCYHYFYLSRWNYEVNDFIDQLEHPSGDQCMFTWGTQEGQCQI